MILWESVAYLVDDGRRARVSASPLCEACPLTDGCRWFLGSAG
jgi:adenine-specific DNA glycosylase